MAKSKTPTAQELYKQRQEREKDAANCNLPPGFVNHGNTCFMNSVLQGLIATRLLKDLIQFKPISPRLLDNSGVLIAPQRSPQVTNSHDFGGEYMKPFSDQMPIGDVFVTLLIRAWNSQDARKRETLTPRALLNTVGKKYDQYLDFAQQDAHEFLRILLDAMSMEEMDVIKKRQPIPKGPKGRLALASIPESERLIPFSDMIFGGRLTSILVCQKCKHISQNYEDFYDLSLSIKPEDYARERKRDRFKNFAKKFKLPSAASSTTGLAISVPGHEARSSSVPPTPKERDDNEMSNGIEDPPITDERRRSVDVIAPAVPTPEPSPVGSVEAAGPSPATPDSAPHVEFKDGIKERSSANKSQSWNKLGRRISVTMGLANRKGRDRTSKDLQAQLQVVSPDPVPQIVLSRPNSPSADEATTSRAPSVSPQPPTRPASAELHRTKNRPRSLSPGKRPKAVSSDPEVEYLIRVLADVGTSNTPQFPLFRSSTTPGDQLAKLSMAGSSLQSVEECLKMFTAVEILDGENRVGCRRCWKMQNGLWPRKDKRKNGVLEKADSGSDSENEDGCMEEAAPPAPAPSSAEMKASSPGSIRSLSDASGDDASTLSTMSSVASPSSSSSISGNESSRTSFETPYTPSTARPSGALPSPPANGSRRNGIQPQKRDDTIRPISLPAPPKPNSPAQVNGGSPQVKDSLALPPKSHRRRTTSETSTLSSVGETTTDDESGSDMSTSVYSDSAVSSNGQPSPPLSTPGSNSSSSPLVSALLKPKPKKKPPKPVVHSPAYKRFLIDVPPPVLVIQLKRFQQVQQLSARSKKIDDYVSFPEILDLKPFLAPRKAEVGLPLKKKEASLAQRKEGDGTCDYRLYAVVVHLGNMLGGHYVSYVALPPSEGDTSPTTSRKRQWAYISDTVVRLTTLEEVLKTKAFMCFYERV